MRNWKRDTRWSAAFLLGMTFVAYGPALRAGFVWDDDAHLIGNAALRTSHGLSDIWFRVGSTPQYYPLVFSTFWIEYHLCELRPFGYHLVNVILHGVSAILLWLVLRRLSVPGAWLAAAVFALHPVHVESVAWVTERKNVLSGMFYLSALLAYLRYVQMGVPLLSSSATGGKSLLESSGTRNWYALAVVLFVCALLSKTVTCSLPAAIMLLLWWKRERFTRRDLWPLMPLFAIGLVMGLITFWVEKHHIGATGPEWSLTFPQRCLVAGRAVWFYAGKLLLPWRLTFIYPRWAIDAGTAWQYLYPVSALGVVFALWTARRRIGAGALVAVLFFVGTLGPALGFVNVFPMRYSFVADHFQYLASIGLIVLATGVLIRYVKPATARVVGALWVVTLGALTWQQAHIYHDLETLWRDTVRKNPTAWLAHNNLGYLLCEQGRSEEGITFLRRALELNPDALEVRLDLADALAKRGQLDEAVIHYRRGVQLRPDYPVGHYNLGKVLALQGRTGEAIDEYRRTLELKPDDVNALHNLGIILLGRGKIDEAVECFKTALRFNPNDPSAHIDLGNVFAHQSKLDEAIEHYGLALRVVPDSPEAHYNLANVLAARKQTDEAINHYKEASRRAPDDPNIHNNLGLAFAESGKIDQAISHFEAAVRLMPDSAEFHNNLAVALEEGGDVKRAIEQYQHTLQIAPGHAESRRRLDALISSNKKPASRVSDLQMKSK